MSGTVPAIHVYPNPAKDNIKVFASNLSDNASINIITTSGKIMKSTKMYSGINSIPITLLSDGMYIIQVINNNHLISSSPFLIAK